MRLVTLKFSSIIDLVDYLFVNPSCTAFIDHEQLSLSGHFSPAAIELAVNGYGAIVYKNKSQEV
jgi:hypothetical protein